jgi:putative hydrolase of HD superfamily
VRAQAFEYEQAQGGMHLQEFFDSTVGKFKTPLGRAWAQELVDRRAAAPKR